MYKTQLTITVLLLLVNIFFPSCGADSPEKRTEKIADAFCGCTSDLIAMNEKMEAMMQDTTQKIDFRLLEAENIKTMECSATIVGKYGKLPPADIAALKQVLTTKCPNLGKLQPEQLDNLIQEMLGE